RPQFWPKWLTRRRKWHAGKGLRRFPLYPESPAILAKVPAARPCPSSGLDSRTDLVPNLTTLPRRPTISLFQPWRLTEEGEDSWPFPRDVPRTPGRASGGAIIT